MKRRDLLAAVGAAGLAGVAPAARAQAYPTKPITVIVPFAAGGPTDALARVVCQKMSEILGQQLVVENIGGAGGTIGVNKVAKAANDGYTLLFTHMGTLAVNIALYKSLPYDSQKDLEPIGLGGTNPMVLVAKKDLPVKTFAEFQDYVKANQKKVQYGMAGIGAASHLGGLMLNSMMKVDVLEIPYKGTGPALNDLVSGQFDYMVDQAVNVLPQIKSGNIKALGVSTTKRLPQLPDVPTRLASNTLVAGEPVISTIAALAIFGAKKTTTAIGTIARRMRSPHSCRLMRFIENFRNSLARCRRHSLPRQSS